MTVPDYVDPEILGSYLHRTRWFGGKGRRFRVTGVSSVASLPGAGPPVVVHVVEVTYDDGGTEQYHVPLVYYPHPEPRLEHASVGWWEHPDHGGVHVYDALHDRAAMARWLAAFGACVDGVLRVGPLTFRRVPGHDLDLGASASLFSGEQSNSSVIFDDDSMMKVFRRITAGTNPDIEIHEALTRAGSPHIAPLYGWLEMTAPEPVPELGGDEPAQLVMLQKFLRTATDGWELALGSVRGLFADADVHVEDSGGDFAAEAGRLGAALREVHDTLTAAFPPAAPLSGSDLADQMTDRLTEALSIVDGLAAHEETLRGIFDRVRRLGEIPAQRVHGDLHLGQTLRAVTGWKLVDFEGEPAKPLDVRRRPDSRWRDVAGMVRSFDYAPRVVARSLDPDEDEETLHAMLAEKWASRNTTHFLAAYTGAAPEDGALLSERDRVLLAAYVADKAVYETVYETRNRPGWVDLPLAALPRIGEL